MEDSIMLSTQKWKIVILKKTNKTESPSLKAKFGKLRKHNFVSKSLALNSLYIFWQATEKLFEISIQNTKYIK